MKKMTAVLLAAVMAFSLAACGGEDTDGTTAAETEESSSTDETEAAAEEPEYFSAFNLDNLSDYVQLGEYKGIEVTAQDTTVTDEDVETELQSQVENATPIYEEITEGTVADGDVVNIDYEGTLDGVAFDGGTDTDFNLTIGSGQFIDGFEDGLIGKNIGDTVELNLTFPEDYTTNSDLAGQDVVFTVTINYVQGEEIPQELNDEFVQRVTDGTYTTVDEYRFVTCLSGISYCAQAHFSCSRGIINHPISSSNFTANGALSDFFIVYSGKYSGNFCMIFPPFVWMRSG